MPDVAVLITREHAVNVIPKPWQGLFAGQKDVLATHRGWDPGALALARCLAGALSVPCFPARVSRLLIDHNRSPHNRLLWSEWSRDLPKAEKERIVASYYEPFREQAARWIDEHHTDGRQVFHLSVHSFTPVFAGEMRNLDLGLLYDPDRPDEALLAKLWKARLLACAPGLRVRFNVPYRGRSDCHLATYRQLYTSRDYLGIELEVNQARVVPGTDWLRLQRQLAQSLRSVLGDIRPDE